MRILFFCLNSLVIDFVCISAMPVDLLDRSEIDKIWSSKTTKCISAHLLIGSTMPSSISSEVSPNSTTEDVRIDFEQFKAANICSDVAARTCFDEMNNRKLYRVNFKNFEFRR